MQSEGVSVAAAALDESHCIILEAVIPGNDPRLSTEKLLVDRTSLLPVRFIIYDTKGDASYRMDYSAFQFDPPLDDSLFTITE